MSIRVRGLPLALLLVFVWAGMAHADSVQDVTVHLSMYCPLDLNICSVSPYQDRPGNPAAGHADFGAINEPWSFAFVTGYPLSWNCDKFCNNYNATFGLGGTFNMEGDGLTLAGQITSGTAWQNLDNSWGANLRFSGQWNNGLSAYGNVVDLVTGMNGPYASLDVYTVPEPRALALLGIGILTVWGIRFRKRS